MSALCLKVNVWIGKAIGVSVSAVSDLKTGLSPHIMRMGLIYYVKIFSLDQTFARLCLSFYVYFPCFPLPLPDMFTACL